MNKFLKLNLQFFSADNGGQGGNGEGNQNQDNQNNNNPPNNEHMIPKSRFDEVNDGFKDFKSKYETLLNEKTSWEQERQTFENNSQTVTTELNNFKTQAEQRGEQLTTLNTFLEGLLNTKVEGLPEGVSDLIPEGDVMSKLNWLSKAESNNVFSTPKANQPLGGATNFQNNQNIDTSKMNAYEKMAMAYQEPNK